MARAFLRTRFHSRQARRVSQLERLENRQLLTATSVSGTGQNFLPSGFCQCPICTGRGLPVVATWPSGTPTVIDAQPASSAPGVPLYASNPSATAKLVLDFDGDVQSIWGSFSNVIAPVFDRDGDATTFSSAEMMMIQDIWTRVSEDYSPFNIDVTTIDPGVLTNRVVAHVAIGGNGSWYASGTGGVAYVGGFYNSASNVGYVFEDNLSSAKSIADASSHEAGHLFGLNHQSLWSGSTKVQEYYSGNSAWGPIMGNSYSSTRSTWYNGTSTVSPTTYQDDIAVLGSTNNGFGLKPDDFGSSLTAASLLPFSGTNINVAGLIEYHTDQDVWQFTTSGGLANVSVSGAVLGPNLDAILEIHDAAGNLVSTSDPADSLSASLTAVLGAGTFYITVRSDGSYGNMGQYALTGTVEGIGTNPDPPPDPQAPEIEVLIGASNLVSGDTVNFGQVTVGDSVTKTITIANSGTGILHLSPLDPNSMPPGFTLVTNIGSQTLVSGESTQFRIRFGANVEGQYGGSIAVLSDDADEGAFSLALQGTITPRAMIIDDNSIGWTKSGPWKQIQGSGYNNDHYELSKSNGSQGASWTFDSIPPGQYRIWATWTGGAGNTPVARFTALEGASTVGAWAVSQRLAASGFTASGADWAELGVVSIAGNQLVIRLANGGVGTLVADAVRIERILPAGFLSAAADSRIRPILSSPTLPTKSIADLQGHSSEVLVQRSDPAQQRPMAAFWESTRSLEVAESGGNFIDANAGIWDELAADFLGARQNTNARLSILGRCGDA